MWPNPQETVDLVTFTEEILNGKLHFLCSANLKSLPSQSWYSKLGILKKISKNEILHYLFKLMLAKKSPNTLR